MFEELMKKITNENTDKEIITILRKDESAKKQINELINRIKDGESKDDIFSLIVESCQDEKFSRVIIDMISSNIRPYEEVRYFRELDFSEFESLITYLIGNILINTEDKDTILATTKLTDNNFTFAIRLMNTVNDYMIIKRFTFGRFKKVVYEMFRFDMQRIEFLWEIFNENKEVLTEAVMLNNVSLCRDVDRKISDLLNIFSGISKESKN